MTTDLFEGIIKKGLDASFGHWGYFTIFFVHDDIMDEAPIEKGKSRPFIKVGHE